MSSNWPSIMVRDLVKNKEAEIKTGPFGTQLHASDYVSEGTPVINARNIGFGDIRNEKLEYISEETVRRLSSHLLRAGDIVFGRKGTVERHSFIKVDQENWFQGTDCLRLRLSSKDFLPRFVSYFLLTESHKQWIINQSSHGATMTSLNQDIIGRITVPMPPLNTQERIVDILSTYDDLIENNTRRIQILEEMAQAIYREWFVHFRYPGHEGVRMVESELGMIPVGWTLSRIDNIAQIYRGKSYGSDNLVEDGGLPFLNLKCVERDGGFRFDGIKRFQGDYKPDQTAKPGDIIIAVTDMTQERRIVAHPARVPNIGEPKFVFSMDLVKLVPERSEDEGFVLSLLMYSGFSEKVKQFANGANVLHLNPERIAEFQFPLPPEELREEFSQYIKPLSELSDLLSLKNKNLRQQRDLLLPRLINGELKLEDMEGTIID